jgi:Fur family peroxide stress response transcriptional regulator
MTCTAKKQQHFKSVDDIKEVFKKRGLKLTQQRLEILNELVNSDNHPDAETIYTGVRGRLPTVSLDTVYRTLWMLLDFGLINTLGPSLTKLRFDGNTQPHHHFICRACSQIYDFYSPELDNLKVPDIISNLGQGERIEVEIKGLCHNCLNKKYTLKNKSNH